MVMMVGPDPWLDVLVVSVGEGEGVVCPAVGVKDPSGDALHVTGDGVRH